MHPTRTRTKSLQSPLDPQVYASLDELVKLRFKASGFSYLPRQPVHSVLSGRHASRLRGRGLNFEELRDYLPGDDIRSIDWKVTARTGKPHVRVFTEERDRPVWLLIDQRSSMFFGSRWKMKSVVAAEAAAVSAWRVLAAGDRVGAVVIGDESMDMITPHRSVERVTQILGQVVKHNHALRAGLTATRSAMFNRALTKISEVARHDCLVTIISDGYGIDDESTKLTTTLSQHNDLIAVFIYDPMEQSLPDAGRLVFSGPPGQLEVNTSADKLRQEYTSAFDERLAWFESASRKFSIPMLRANTIEPVLDQIKQQLGYHASTRRW